MPVRLKMILAVVLVPLAVIAVSTGASTAAPKAKAPSTTKAVSTPKAPSTPTVASKSPAAGWKWSKSQKLPGKGKRNGIGGISCPSAHLCIADAAGVNAGPDGIYYTTDPGGSAK